MIEYDYHELATNSRVNFIAPPAEAEIDEAEKVIGYPFPPLIRQWIIDFGIIRIIPDVKKNPKLVLFGLGLETTLYDDIILFNDPSNPSRPSDYLVFAYSHDGEKNYVYALRPDGAVACVCNWFAFPDYADKTPYAGAKWYKVFNSLDEFWINKVKEYLEW